MCMSNENTLMANVMKSKRAKANLIATTTLILAWSPTRFISLLITIVTNKAVTITVIAKKNWVYHCIPTGHEEQTISNRAKDLRLTEHRMEHFEGLRAINN